MKGYIGPTYHGHPYLDGRGVWLDGHPLDRCAVDTVDQDLIRRDPPWSKASHPYSYCPFTIWGEPWPSPECNGSVDDDRLSQADHDKYERLKAKHYHDATTGRYLAPFSSNHCKGNLIEAFLRDWYDDPALKLLRVVEYCKPYNGYPVWSLYFKRGTP